MMTAIYARTQKFSPENDKMEEQIAACMERTENADVEIYKDYGPGSDVYRPEDYPSETAGLIEDIESCIEVGGIKLKQVASEIQDQKLNQAASEMPFPAIFAYVPWMHHVLIVQKCRSNGDYSYHCEIVGEFEWFQGTESICYKGTEVYECVFHGGLIE